MNGKIKSNTDIIVSYHDNKNVITVLYILAVKSKNTNRFIDFCRLNYKLLESDWNTNADFWLTSMDTEFKLYFRIKNMDKVIEYIKECPENVISKFMVSDNGCANRISGTCVSGISYQLNDKTIWRCGCCNPNFQVNPSIDDYLYYINAVDLAGKK